MSRPTVPTCDECGAQKKETNHWWAMHVRPAHLNFPAGIELTTFEDCPGLEGTVLDLCSEQCVTRAIGKWMRGELK